MLTPLFNLTKMSLSTEEYYFSDDGVIPNSKLPFLVYKNAFSARNTAGAEWLESTFKKNNWYNSWRWGIYDFHHYHSNTHEVLGVFQGNAKVMMGGPNGKEFNISAGDILVIPAGVGHKCISHSPDFTVVGAYPNGKSPDLVKEEPTKHSISKQTISKVPVPTTDPLLGKDDGLVKLWK